MNKITLIVFLLSFLALVQNLHSQQAHQLTTLAVQNINQWGYQNLRHHHKKYPEQQLSDQKQHHDTSSGKNAATDLFLKYLLGPILFLSSFGVIWLNERKAVLDHRRLQLSQQICRQVNPNNKEQILENQGQLTYVSGSPTTTHVIQDKVLNITVKNAMKLTRTVQVMEWRLKNPDDKNQHKEYVLDWCNQNQTSVPGKNNPEQNWFIDNQTFYNPNVSLGRYNISSKQIDMCLKSHIIKPQLQSINQIQRNKKSTQKGCIVDDFIYFPSKIDNQINGEGALRIKYEYCPLGALTIVAKTVNNSFQPFPIAQYENNGQKNQDDQLPLGCICCAFVQDYLIPIREIDFLFEQSMKKEALFDRKRKQTTKFTFIVRAVSFLMMFVGLCLIFVPIIDILGYVPFVGGFIRSSLFLVVVVGGLIICIPLWIITFSIAWTWYHPKIGVIFLCIGLAIFSGILLFNHLKVANT